MAVNQMLIQFIFKYGMKSCLRFILDLLRITNCSNHRRVWTAKLLHELQLPNPRTAWKVSKYGVFSVFSHIRTEYKEIRSISPNTFFIETEHFRWLLLFTQNPVYHSNFCLNRANDLTNLWLKIFIKI